MRRFGITIATMIFGACLAQAGEKGLMHCFAFTPIAEASQADWAAFYKATDAMPSKMPFVKNVWVGKLRAPLNVSGAKREYGACFWFNGGPEVLKQYTAHPYHKEWSAAYEKVRVAGTTTYDIIGQ
jgi:hypothetical protein